MPRKRSSSIPTSELAHRWYLQEWAALAGKIQADAQRDLGWSKASASALWNNKQRYTQQLIDQVAAWLELEPFEVLMPPAKALALRDLHKAATTIVGSAANGPVEPHEMLKHVAERGRAYDPPTPRRSPAKKAG